MNVLRDTAILDLQRNNVEVIDEQLRQTRDRFNVGEVTRTDVAQAEARLAAVPLAGQPRRGQPAHQYRAAIARSIGVEPRQLAPGRPLDKLAAPQRRFGPEDRASTSIRRSRRAMHGVDVAELQVKIDAGRACAATGRRGCGRSALSTARAAGDNSAVGFRRGPADRADLRGRPGLFAHPPGEGDAGQRRLEADSIRDQVRAAVISVLGPARGRPGPDHRRAGAGPCRRNRAQRRPRRSPRRPAHHPRRLERAAGTAERPRQSHHRPARPGGRLLRGRPGDGTAQFPGPRPDGRPLQPEDPLTIRSRTFGSASRRRTAAEKLRARRINAPASLASHLLREILTMLARVGFPASVLIGRAR